MSLASRRGSPYGDIQSQLIGLQGSAVARPVKVQLDGEEEEVYIDPERGPKVGPGQFDHMNTFMPAVPFGDPKPAGPGGQETMKKCWADMSGTEKEVWIILSAKKIRAKRRVQQAREERDAAKV
uniref:Uncharacterized protein n=1 Tax=Alexandrium andersonii TaxID=327968 RepID=A0A7S2F188_9DINO|mmetsp:Transcript_12551/g.28427  ORF Transcript_12551/g.28427 Transcript_12551/m.28427 type:complete len:124 (+) Transcript_12551:101-472(+)